MKNHKTFVLKNRLEFPEPITSVMLVRKNRLIIVTGKAMYEYKGASKPEKIKRHKDPGLAN